MGDLATGAAWEEPSPGETTGTVLILHVDAAAHGPTGQERNARPQAKSATTVRNSDISQKYADISQTIKIMKRLQSNTLKQKNSLQTTSKVSTPPLLHTNEQVKAPIKCLKTTTRVHHIQGKDTEHIRPLWVAQSQGFQILQTDCKVDTGAGCNILPVHKAQQLFGQE